MLPVCILSNYVKPALLKTDGAACNCSLFEYNGKSYLVARSVTYTKCGKHSFVNNGKCHTTNYLYAVDSDYSVRKLKILTSPYFNALNNRYNGLEDVRVIKWGGSLYFLGTLVLGNTDKGTMCYGKVVNLEFCEQTEIPTGQLREKNWMPVETRPFCCVYSTDPYKIVNVKSREFFDIDEGFGGSFSGSSPVVPYKNGKYISLVHKRDAANNYIHYFVVYNQDLRVYTISQPFCFFGSRVEFCIAIKVNKDGVILIPSVNDGISYIFEISNCLLERLLGGVVEGSTYGTDIYNKFYEDALSIGAKEVAATMAVMATNPKYVADALVFNHDVSTWTLAEKAHRQGLLLANYRKLKK